MGEETKKVNRIGRDFTLPQLIWFAVPAILTHLCTQLFHSLDDGLFVSRFVGPSALASISIVSPVNSILMAIGQLLAVGASTLSAQRMGKHEQLEAKRIFSRIAVWALIIGGIFALGVNIFVDPILNFLGADESLVENSRTFVRIVMTNAPIHILSVVFSSYYSTAGKPKMGLFCSILNGSINIVLDFLLVAILKWGIVGSSLSTVIGEVAVVIVGLCFYTRDVNEVHFVKPQGGYAATLGETWSSGFSQFINSMAFSVTNFVTNKTILAYMGPDGISANSIIADLRIIMNAAFVGYITCVGPILAYNYGNRNAPRLKKLLSHNIKMWFFGTLGLTILGQLLRSPLISIFFGSDTSTDLFKMTYEGLTIEYFSCMFSCGCIFVMRMFVALGSPKTSSTLTFFRNIVFRISIMLLLPMLFGSIGVWLAFPVSEALSFGIAAILVVANAKNYGYGKSGLALRMQGGIIEDPLTE